MAINFCNVAFGAKVTCSSVSTDGYEIENLLKPGRYGEMKGFLAEHFIKPPLSITFDWPFKIDICSVIIDPNIGSQKSSGIEIFTSMTPEAKQISGNDVGKDVDSECMVVSTNIGKGYCNNSFFPRLICFYNRRYRSLSNVTTQPLLYQEGTEGVLIRDIRCYSAACVRNVNQIVIKITRVHGASVPALKKVEIWGKPAASCDQSLVEKILKTVKQLQGLDVKKKESALNKRQSEMSKQVKKKENSPYCGKEMSEKKEVHLDPSDEIPEEFVDPITCSIMVIPILLPSGHTIDQDTLEKHKQIEATWGRPPNDPFTGVPFSSVSKPIANVKLKARLDKFLLTDGAKLKDVPRTAAEASDWDLDVQDSKVKSSIIIQPMQKESGARTKVHSSNDRLPQEPVKTHVGNGVKMPQGKRKRKTEPSEAVYVNEQYARITAKKSKVYGVHVDEDLVQNEGRNTVIKKDLGSHERAVSTSLDDALASTLASLPSYNKPSTAATAVSQEACHDICVNCTSTLKDCELGIYTMPCKHLICRTCTSIQTNGITCRSCEKIFKTSDLFRVHKRVNSTAIR